MQRASNSARTLPILLLATLGLAALVFAAVYFSRPVATVAPTIPGLATDAVPGSVTVKADREMELKSEIGGRIIRSDLDPGRHFREGDFLVQIDPGDLLLEIERIESDYEAHKKRIAVGSQIALELITMREELDAVERLFKSGSSSEADVVRRSRIVKQYEQRLALEEVENQQKTEGYENTLKVKRRQLDKMTISAPFDGVVAAVYAEVGDLIGNDAPIARLISTARLVEAKVSEENFSGLKVGQKASVRFLGYGPQLYGASVTKVLPTADPETQRYIIHLNVDLPPEKLVPGLTGEVSIVIGERDARTIIPRRALRGNKVLAVRGGRVEERAVEVGYVGLNQVEILSGLQTGEQVIVEELERFKDGDRVRGREAREL
jgi:RND family efflux transporter MFP subunit